MAEKSFHEVLKKLLLGEPISEENKRYIMTELRNILNRVITTIGIEKIRWLYGFEENEEAFGDAMIHITSKSDLILEKLNHNPTGIKAYIRTTIHNLLKDNIKKKIRATQGIHIDNNSSDIENKAHNIFHNPGSQTVKNQYTQLEVKETLKSIFNELTDAEKEALCYTIHGVTPSNRTKAAFEKARSRAKSKIASLARKKHISQEAMELVLKALDLSKICEKIVYLNRKTKNRR